jgi:phosphoribosylanthranilate isomerase
MLTTYSGETPFLLSGGITPDDVEAVNTFSHPQFDGVDLNSGFETAAAIKDIFTLRRFMAQLRS